MKKLIAGNWKMHGDKTSAAQLTSEIIQGMDMLTDVADFLVCAPFVHLGCVEDILKNSALSLGAQDCVAEEQGAFTGDISAPMLKDVGCEYVILGHSERRTLHGETSETVSQKAVAAHLAGLKTIICVGENKEEREAGEEQNVVAKQLAESVPSCSTAGNTVIAYEPVWAIGTGLSAKPDDISSMHGFINDQMKERLESVDNLRILYGGSVKPENAKEILNMPHVEGALIGGASLKAESFLGIAKEI